MWINKTCYVLIMWLWWRWSFKYSPKMHNTAKAMWHMAWCHHTEPQPVSWAVFSVWLTCNKTWHLMTSPACATSDNKTTATLSLRVCGLSSSRWQLFLKSWLCAELPSLLDIVLILQCRNVSSFVFSRLLHRPSLYSPLLQVTCICLLTETLPRCPSQNLL